MRLVCLHFIREQTIKQSLIRSRNLKYVFEMRQLGLGDLGAGRKVGMSAMLLPPAPFSLPSGGG